MAPLFSFPDGLITKVPNQAKARESQISLLFSINNILIKTIKHLHSSPLEALLVLVSEGLSEVAPSFSLSADESDPFPVFLATEVDFLK